MSWVFEIVCQADATLGDALRRWVEAESARAWRALPGLSALDVYRPAEGGAHDPFNDDSGVPALIVMIEFSTRPALLAAHSAVDLSLATLPAGVAATLTAMERRFYPVDQEQTPAPLRAPFSYVVRYHRPAEDEAAFIANYVATHPETLARLPHIRSVICYFPISGLAPGRIRPADYMIGNEVVFDTITDFNLAMRSPVRHELRQHFHMFPKFTGLNTHFAMTRTRIFG